MLFRLGLQDSSSWPSNTFARSSAVFDKSLPSSNYHVLVTSASGGMIYLDSIRAYLQAHSICPAVLVPTTDYTRRSTCKCSYM